MPATLRSVLQTTLSALRLPCSTDADLLAAFAATRDESAFAEVVRRHGGLVLGTSLRAVGDRGTAEDVFQATFLLLARKAASVSWGPTVGPWLYQAVRRLAAKARAGAARRSLPPLPRDIPAPAGDPSAGLARAEIRDALDEALAALPAHLREPLVLCYLEGLTQDEAAAALRCPPATIKGRVTRGRERLRKLLERRGLSLSVALSGLLVSEASVSAGAAAITARAATVFATTGAASPKVLALLGGTTAGLKLAAGLFGLLLACAAVAGLVGGSPVPKGVAKGAVRAAPPVALAEPLPAGAVARLGTRWLCGPSEPTWVGFSPDGKKVASKGMYGVTVWDAATGKPLVERNDYIVRNTPAWRADGTGVAAVMLADGWCFTSAFTDPNEKLPVREKAHENAAPKRGPDALDMFALSPDGLRLAIVRDPAGERFTIEILHAVPNRPISALKPERHLGPFAGPVQEIRFTADGGLVFLSAKGNAIKDWSLSLVDPVKNSIRRTTRIPAPGYGGIGHYMLSLSADGGLAAFAPQGKQNLYSHEGTLRVWDLKAGKELRSFPFPKALGYGTGHAFTPDGKYLIASTDEVYFRVWDLATGKETARSSAAEGPFRARNASAIAVSPDGKRFATARRDGRVDLWHTATGNPAINLDTHRDVVDAVAASPDGRLGATLSYDGTVRVWNLATGETGCVISAPPAGELDKGGRSNRRLTFTRDGRALLFPAGDELAMANPTTGKRLELPAGLRNRAAKVGGFSSDGKKLMTFVADKVEHWDWPAGTLRGTITVPLPDELPGQKEKPDGVSIGSAALSPDGQFVFVSLHVSTSNPKRVWHEGSNEVWDALTGKRLHQLMKSRVGSGSAAFSPDSRVLYLSGQSIQSLARGRERAAAHTMWNPATGKLIRDFDYANATGVDPLKFEARWTDDPFAVSPDGRLLAAGAGGVTAERSVWLYETASGKVITKFPGHSRRIAALGFSSDNRRLVSTSQDQTGLVWDVAVPALGGKSEKNHADAWGKLADPDPAPAYAAMAALVADPAKSLPLLRKQLRPAPAPSDAEVDAVIARLDADSFADREKASADLERLGPKSVPRVEARLAKGVSAEARRRLDRHLAPYAGSKPSRHLLRCVRGVAVVEAIGSPDARALLAEWAKGPKDDPLTREAEAAMRRGSVP